EVVARIRVLGPRGDRIAQERDRLVELSLTDQDLAQVEARLVLARLEADGRTEALDRLFRPYLPGQLDAEIRLGNPRVWIARDGVAPERHQIEVDGNPPPRERAQSREQERGGDHGGPRGGENAARGQRCARGEERDPADAREVLVVVLHERILREVDV